MEYDTEVPRKIAEVLVRKVPDDQQVSKNNIIKIIFSILLFRI